MSNCCVLCYLPRVDIISGAKSKVDNKGGSVEKKFFGFLDEYLTVSSKAVGETEGTKEEDNGYKPDFVVGQALSAGMVGCENCRKTMDSFCNLYYQWRQIEDQLNGTLKVLKCRLNSGDEYSTKIHNLWGRSGQLIVDRRVWNGSEEVLNLLMKLHGRLIKKCNNKLGEELPTKLSIDKWKPPVPEKNVPKPAPAPQPKLVRTYLVVKAGAPPVKFHNEGGPVGDCNDALPKISRTASISLRGTEIINNTLPPKDPLSDDVTEVKEELEEDNSPAQTSSAYNAAQSLAQGLIIKNLNTPGKIQSVRVVGVVGGKTSKIIARGKTKVTPLLLSSTNKLNRARVANRTRKTVARSKRIRNTKQKIKVSKPRSVRKTKKEEGEGCDAGNNDDIESTTATKRGARGVGRKRGSKIVTKKLEPYRFKCTHCESDFVSLHEMIDHRKEIHLSKSTEDEDKSKSSRLTVDIVQYPPHSTPSSELPVYAKIEVNDSYFTCPVDGCNTILYCAENMKRHLKLHGGFKCFVCDHEEKYAPDLCHHERSHTEECVKFQCLRCSKIFTTQRRYVQHHVSDHLGLQLVDPDCAVCGKYRIATLKVKINLFLHYKTYHNLNDMEDPEAVKRCPVENCSAYFFSQLKYCLHLSTEHGYNYHSEEYKAALRELMKCDICGKGFANKRHFDRHRQTVHAAALKFFDCSVDGCDRKFEAEAELNEHLTKYHNESKSKKCPICDRIIKLGTHHWDVHMATHKDEEENAQEPRKVSSCNRKLSEPVLCQTCGKCFDTKLKLKRHLVTHLPPGQHTLSCELCGKNFTTKATLRLHAKVHTKEKNFTCSACGKAVTSKYTLWTHESVAHGIGPERKWGYTDGQKFACSTCGKEYTTPRGVRIHESREHGIGPPMRWNRPGRPTWKPKHKR